MKSMIRLLEHPGKEGEVQIRAQRINAAFAALVIAICITLISAPVLALTGSEAGIPIAFGAMSDKTKAKAKDVEVKRVGPKAVQKNLGDAADKVAEELS
jgi:hypothetical protein